MISIVVVALASAIACSKAASEKPQVEAVEATSEPGDKPALNAADKKKNELEKLAQDYHTVRCVLVGAKAGVEKLYDELGYGDVEAFNKAFEDAAKREPSWAKATLAASYDRSCQEKQP